MPSLCDHTSTTSARLSFTDFISSGLVQHFSYDELWYVL